MIYIILGLAWFTGALLWNVNHDFKVISNGGIDHPTEGTKLVALRAALLVPSSILFLLPNFSILIIPVIILMQGVIFWEFFDGLLNKKRGYPWRFNGGVGPEDSKFDKFLYNLSSTQQGLLKWGLITIFITLYIILL